MIIKFIPSVTATNACAWAPLLQSHLGRVQPIVDRWRGTLDTILVFVSLAFLPACNQLPNHTSLDCTFLGYRRNILRSVPRRLVARSCISYQRAAAKLDGRRHSHRQWH